MYKYTLTMHTRHDRTSEDILTSNDLQSLKDTADHMKGKLYKDQTITIVDNTTGEVVYMVERG